MPLVFSMSLPKAWVFRSNPWVVPGSTSPGDFWPCACLLADCEKRYTISPKSQGFRLACEDVPQDIQRKGSNQMWQKRKTHEGVSAEQLNEKAGTQNAAAKKKLKGRMK